MKRPNSLVFAIALSAVGLSTAACADLLGIDDFQPPPGDQPPAEDSDPPGEGGAGGGGVGGSTSGSPSWAQAYGAADRDHGHGISATSDDGVVVSGVIEGRVDFGGGLIGSGDGAAVFAAQFDADGAFVSSVASAGSGQPQMAAMAGLPTGVVLAGHYSDGDLQLGDSMLDAATGAANNLFVARLDGQGNVVDAVAFSSDDRAEIRAVAVDPSTGEILIGGVARGAMQFDTLPLAAASHADAFVAKLAADLTPMWVTSLAAPSDQADQWVSALAFNSGRWFAAGRFAGNVAAGNQVMTSQGVADAFLIEIDGAGAPVAGSQYGGTSSDMDATAVVASDAGVVLAGHFTRTISFGGDALESAGDSDLFVAGLSSTGEHQWSASFGGSGPDRMHAMAIDDAGAIALAGSYSSIFAAGATSLESAGDQDVLVLKVDQQGRPLWAHGFGRNEADAAYDVAFDSAGAVLLTGSFSSGMIVDEEVLKSNGGDDVFVAKFGK